MEQINISSIDVLNEAFYSLIDCADRSALPATAKKSDITSSELVLYGAGNMGLDTILWLQGHGLRIKCFVDTSESKIGSVLKGYPVIHPSDISEKDKSECIFLICVVTVPYYEIYSMLHHLGCMRIYPAWDIIGLFNHDSRILCGWSFHDMSEEEAMSVVRLYEALGDEISKAHYFQALYWRVMRQEVLMDFAPIMRVAKYFPSDVPFRSLENEVYVDCGAFDGYTIDSFIKWSSNNYKMIYAFEPGSEGFEALTRFTDDMEINSRIKIIQAGLGAENEDAYFVDHMGQESHFTSVKSEVKKQRLKLDTALCGENVTFVKIHAEGDDLDVLLGAMSIITKQRPVIAVTIFHNKSDFVEIPRLLINTLSHYMFYVRAYCYCGIETVFYAIPYERIVN